jgi:recombinational DNA repair protein (RecF pathway)
MISVALRAYSTKASSRFWLKCVAIAGVFTLLTACAGVGTSVGISVPIGRVGGVGVSVGSGGTVSGSVGVGSGGGSVSVGASGQLPKPAEKKPDAETEKKEEKKP